MQIDVAHIAKLARLRLEQDQIETFSKQMNDILAMVEQLPELSGQDSGLDASHPMELRPDVIKPSMKRDELLKNAPQVQAGCVVVPRIVE